MTKKIVTWISGVESFILTLAFWVMYGSITDAMGWVKKDGPRSTMGLWLHQTVHCVNSQIQGDP